MASDNEASCESDPNFAVICAFMEKFGTTCGLQSIDFLGLQEMLENTQEVPQELIDLHIKLLRKSRKTVSNERWEKAIIKFCHSFCIQDAWEIERFGYKKARLSSKLRVLKELLEMQFDYNSRFKAEINKMSAEELRSQPLGKDKQGHAYWFQNDNNCQIRVYKEDPDEETWTLVAKDRDGLASLINELSDGDSKISTESAINEEDSNSLAEKPIIDTGQVDSSSESTKKMSGDSDNSNESKESTKKEENISPQEDGDIQSDEIEEKEENIKRVRESDDENGNATKKIKPDVEVSEAIEEPLMLVKGEGNGDGNKCVNPIIGDEIVEDLMFVYGEGNGRDCETGNEDKSETQNKQSEKSGNESKSVNRDASDSGLVSISDSKNCEVPTSPVKSPYKLGTIIDTKTDNKFFSTVKNPTKKSRWDVDTIISKETSETGRVKELVNQWEQKDIEAPKKSMFFFGPGCLQFTPATVGFGQKVPAESLDILPGKEKGDVGYRIEDGDNKTETNDCVQNLGNEVDETPLRINKKLEQTKVEEEIITKDEEIHFDGNEKYPEVTATLVGCSEEIRNVETASDLVPVVEEICVKKHAYLLGDNHQPEIESETVIKKNNVGLNEKKQEEKTSSIDENDNKQVISELKNEEIETTDDIRIDTQKGITNDEEVAEETHSEDKFESKEVESVEALDVSKPTEENTTLVVATISEEEIDKNEDVASTTEDLKVQTVEKTILGSEDQKIEEETEKPNLSTKSNKADEEKDYFCVKTEKATVEDSLDEEKTEPVDTREEIAEETVKESDKVIEEVKSEALTETRKSEAFLEIVQSEAILEKYQTEEEEEFKSLSEKPESEAVSEKSEGEVVLEKSDGEAALRTLECETVSETSESEAVSEKQESEAISEKLEVEIVSEKLESEAALEKLEGETVLKNSESKASLEKPVETISVKPKSEAVSEKLEGEKTVSNKVEGESVVEQLEDEPVSEKLGSEGISENSEGGTVLEKSESEVTLERIESATVLEIRNSEAVSEKTDVETVLAKSEVKPEADLEELKSQKVSEEVKPEDADSKLVSEDVKSKPISEEVKPNAALKERKPDASLEESPQAETETAKLVEETKVEDNKLEEKFETPSLTELDEKQEIVNTSEETVSSSIEDNKQFDIPKMETENHNKEESKDSLKRSRKNNSDPTDEEKKPRVATRRSTRSSKTEELVDDQIAIVQSRRGRTRSNQKTPKEENSEDVSKKMKMTIEESQPEIQKATKNKQNQKDDIEKPEDQEVEELVKETETVVVESSSSNDIVEVIDRDPLAVSEEEPKTTSLTLEEESKELKPMSLANFSLDFNESSTPPLTRSGLRKRSRESPQNSEEPEEAVVGKRPKMKAKRAVDVKLRKSIEEQKKKELISSDDDSKAEDKSDKKIHKKSEEVNDESVNAEKETPSKKNKKNKNKRLLSNLGIDPERVLVDFDQQPVIGVRQSRRIAQLKIKEEAERRKLEEELMQETHKKKKSKKNEDKDYKVERKKPKNDDDDEEAEEDSNDSKKRKKKKKKKHRKLFDELNPWRSSSDSSSSNEEDEMGEEEEEEDEDVLQYVSDHEFSPESDLEGDGEAQPLKRARTARKESDVEEVDDCPCQKCGKSDHPEWILLCDSCDNGWHCSCLRPPLLVIPEGDWFCPPCQHSSLLEKLTEKLKEYDRKLNKKEIEDRRKQRLAYVGISLNSVLPAKDTENIKKRRIAVKKDDDDDDDDAEVEDGSSDDDSESESASTSEEDASDSDEPIYQLRQRRQAHSYRFNDYDELINSAIQDEMEAVKGAGNQGRGKDIATIVNAEKEEERKKELEATQIEGEELEPLPPVVPVDEKDKDAKPLFEVDEPITVKKKIIGRKKHRKLNALDISSADDDEDSDEDFKGTSDESEDEFDDDLGSEYSDDLDNGRNRRKGSDPIRRSTRARTSRYDADFIDDGDSDSEDEAPRRKKKRSIWDESESEESDRSWGRRKRKPVNRSKKSTPSTTTKKKKSKKKKKQQDSDEEVYKKKKPKIKFGLDGDDDGPVRRTRGKKINYIDALGSDSDEDRGKRPVPRIESDEDFVANEDEKVSEEEHDSGDENKASKIQIQSYTDARFTQLLPEPKSQPDESDELNPIDQINRNVEMMDENEMEKMMEDEEYANKHLQMVAMQLEKEKRRKEREAKKMLPQPVAQVQEKKRPRKLKDDFQFSGSMQEPLVDSLMANSENNDELSEPPGVSLPLFSELGVGGDNLEESAKKRKNKKSLEEAVANLGSIRQQDTGSPYKMLPTDLSMPQETNIEIAAPPQPFSQSQPTPSVITRMLQSKPGQPGYPIGTIRPKQFASMPEREEESLVSSPYLPGAAAIRPQLSSPYRQLPPTLNHYPRNAPPPIRNPVPHIFHSHRPLDPSPSGGGPISISDSSPGRVVSPAASSPGSNKNETPPPPYSRPAAPVGRFPLLSAGARHVQMVAPSHLQPRASLSPYHPGMPPQYHYGQFGQEDALPPTMYQNSPYSETFEGGVNPAENSNSKSFEDESGGEFGGLVSYFSSQREDDLES